MSFSSWLRNWKRSVEHRSLLNQTHRRKTTPSCVVRRIAWVCPRLEVLEDRLAPATLTVTNPDDPAALTPGTLRYAVSQANADASAGQSDTIEFSGVTTITLSQGQLELSGQNSGTPATIIIDGGGQVTLDGDNTRIFQVDSGVQATLTGLTIQDGNAGQYGDGGAIYNENGSLTVSYCTLSSNQTGEDGAGGAIYNDSGSLTVSYSTLSSNQTDSNQSGPSGAGGAIYNQYGSVTVSYSTLSSNESGEAGGIFDQGTLIVNNSTLQSNSSSDCGGIDVSSGGLTLSNSTLADNSASFNGGGIFFWDPIEGGTATISNSVFTGNSATGDSGGAIYVDGFSVVG